MNARILIVAGDAQLRATVARWLMSAGYGVELAEGIRRTREVLAHGDILLAIMALEKADAGGEVSLRSEVRRGVRHLITIGGQTHAGFDPQNQPDVSMSSASAEADLLGRVRAALNGTSAAAGQADPAVLRFEGYTLDAGGRTLRNADGQEIALTAAEFSMLLALARQAGRVLARDKLSQEALGRAAGPDDRSVDVLISRLRRKIEPSPKTPTIILTVPGGGYKLGVASQITASPPTSDAKSMQVTSPVSGPDFHPRDTSEAKSLAPPRAPLARQARLLGMSPRLSITIGLLVLGSIGGLIIGFRSMAPPSMRVPTLSAAPGTKFDPAVVPLIFDRVRTQLADYAREPPAKAIAISREGWGVSSGAADETAARNEAIARCHERDKGGFCRLYAVGDNVVWPASSLRLPLPADIRDDSSALSAVTPESLNKVWQAIWHISPPSSVTEYLRGKDHRAFAVSLTSMYRAQNYSSRDEAVRIAIERCSDLARTPCLLISVDGLWTVEVPRSYAITAPFTLAGESQMSDAERQRVATIYAGRDWRALARGSSGAHYAVEGRENEAAAVDAALHACRGVEPECTLHAIGNWRIGDKLGARPN